MGTTPAPSDCLVVVTGASNGIGLEIALEAARDGHPVLLVARGQTALDSAAAAVSAAGAPFAFVLAADLATQEGVDAVAARVEELDLPIAALVNNAGFGAWGPFAEQSTERLASMIDLNDRAVVLLTRMLLDRIMQGCGGILTVASIAAFQPGPGMVVYHASKAFALSFSVGLREELRGTGVRATALCPGPVATGFATAAGNADLDDMLRTRISAVPADKVARMAWNGLKRNEAVVVPGAVNRLGALGAKIAPLTLATRMARTALGAIDRHGRSTLPQPQD
ncbi:MAG: short-chain dehydrogenase [Thermoleophilia bacterium]|nr:short-chain dehydrogenase [Thermoleophilia bacterium]